MNEKIEENIIKISNDGPLIKSTNYWNTPYFREGFAFLTCNAGTARILLPDLLKSSLREMKTADYVIMSRGLASGVDAIEIMFEDHSDAPYCLVLGVMQTHQVCSDTNIENFPVTVWTRGGIKLRLPGKYRNVGMLPCLQPWQASLGSSPLEPDLWRRTDR